MTRASPNPSEVRVDTKSGAANRGVLIDREVACALAIAEARVGAPPKRPLAAARPTSIASPLTVNPS